MKINKFLTLAVIVLISILILVYVVWSVGNVKTGDKKPDQPQVAVAEPSQRIRISSSRDCSNCPEMIVIPAGSFEMGETGYTHHVTIDKPFAIGKYEVTQAQWQAVMGNNPSYFLRCGGDCPVEQVSWDEVKKFIRKFNQKTGKRYRLPSESEWEYACRAGGRNEYCGSDDMSSVSWNGGEETHPVGGKQANAFGLHDMSGNVWEWVQDTWHENYNGAPANGAAWSGNTSYHVLRGGTWFSLPKEVSATSRGRSIPPHGDAAFGFRLAMTLR
jgi:formylglycine-generating enzyme required for sulfatase activity